MADVGVISYLKEHDDHFHARERWFGISADQSGNDWALEAGLTPFRAISGNGIFGEDANDEAKVLGTDDTPVIAGKRLFDMHEIFITALSAATVYILRFIWGTGTMAASEALGQYADVPVMKESAAGRSLIQEIRMPKVAADTKVWCRAKNATDNATADFLVGLHEYD